MAGAQIRLRRGTAAEWVAANTLLASGEVGYESDTGRKKVGDGVTTWNGLPYDDAYEKGRAVAAETTSANNIANHVAGAPAHSAAHVSVAPGAGVTATDVQAAILQVTGFITSQEAGDSAAVAALSAQVAGKATDSAVVHNTGNESIAGTKTFQASPVIPGYALNGESTVWDYGRQPVSLPFFAESLTFSTENPVFDPTPLGGNIAFNPCPFIVNGDLYLAAEIGLTPNIVSNIWATKCAAGSDPTKKASWGPWVQISVENTTSRYINMAAVVIRNNIVYMFYTENTGIADPTHPQGKLWVRSQPVAGFSLASGWSAPSLAFDPNTVIGYPTYPVSPSMDNSFGIFQNPKDKQWYFLFTSRTSANHYLYGMRCGHFTTNWTTDGSWLNNSQPILDVQESTWANQVGCAMFMVIGDTPYMTGSFIASADFTGGLAAHEAVGVFAFSELTAENQSGFWLKNGYTLPPGLESFTAWGIGGFNAILWQKQWVCFYPGIATHSDVGGDSAMMGVATMPQSGASSVVPTGQTDRLVGTRIIHRRRQTITGSYTPKREDDGAVIEFLPANGLANADITIPLTATAFWQVGTEIEFTVLGTGQLGFQGAAGVTVSAPGVAAGQPVFSKTQYSNVRLRYRGSDQWVVAGDITPTVAPFTSFLAVPWYTAADTNDALWIPPADGGAVSAMLDGSGNSRPLLQATSAKQPVYVASSVGLNNKRAISNDGAAQYMQTALFAALKPFSLPGEIVIIGRLRSTGGVGYLVSGNGSTTTISLFTSATQWKIVAGTGAAGSGGTTDTAKHFFRITHDGTNLSLAIDGTTVIGPSALGTAVPTKLTVGARYDGTNFAPFDWGFVGAINRLLTTAEAANLLALSRSFYGTP